MMTEEEHNTKLKAELENKTKLLNYRWAVCCLVLVVIGFVAGFFMFKTKQFNYDGLIKTLGLISTLLAIILSVFSILFSYHSSVKAEGALNQLEYEVKRFESTYSHLTNLIQPKQSPNNNTNENNKQLLEKG